MVDSLMALRERMETAPATATNTRRHFLEALLHEALAPTEATVDAG